MSRESSSPGEAGVLRLADDSALVSLALEATSSLLLGDVLRAVVDGLVRELGVEAAYLWLESAAGGEGLELVASAGLDPESELPPPALLSLRRADDHFCTNEIPLDGSSGPRGWLEAHGLRAVAAYPLIFRGERLGVLGIYSVRRLTEHAFKRLFLFAQQAAIAIQNARLFTEVSTLRERLSAENAYLRSAGDAEQGELVAKGRRMREVRRLIDQVAATESTVLLEGETGTGKELVARAIHLASRRAARTLVKINCAAISPSLVESELFGHERGAFTGASATRIGRFELADGGTLFLDEIGELPLDLQPKLLRALQEREIERVGSSRTRRVDVRVIAATNRTLVDEVRAGRFRADLFYRLAVFPIQLPPLRERREDIAAIARSTLNRLSRRLGRQLEGFTEPSIYRLERYDWPGNVRELLNVVERAAILSGSSLVEVPTSLLPGVEVAAEVPSRVLTMVEVERRYLESVLVRTDWCIEGPAGAAEILGLRPSTLRSRLAKLKLRRDRR